MLITLLSILTGLNVSLAATEVLSLDQYLNQVKAKGTNYLAAFSTSQGALKRSNESDLLISPTLFSNIQIGTDRSPRNNPSFEGTRADQQSFELGVSQVTTFGLSGRIYYSLSNTTIYGASSSFLPQPSYYLGRPTLELSQPLIRNGLGSETQALIEASRAQALMTHHLEDYRARMSLVQAEMSYWRLTAAREILAIQNENLERAKKLREWNTGRAKLRLADHSDVLQAEANYRFRLMEQHSAMDEERSASESFNSLRGLSSKSVQESLVKLGDAASLRSDHLIELKKEIIRSDAQSIVEGFKLADASAKMGYEKNLPTLDLVGSVSLNGRSETLSPAVSESLKTQQNIAGVQLKFSMPFNIGQGASDRAAYQAESVAAEARRDRAIFDEERDWSDLIERYKETRKKLDLSQELELAQKEKYEYERGRQSGGRSTTFIVLQFEQDYALAQTMRIRVQAELLGLLAQAKLYKKEGG